ncbi:MAG: permease prefix domain 1-containing protein [Planctomycetota bacterium]|nr:permease prefix domain 1-containing protein [Planctomycetota bacterium]
MGAFLERIGIFARSPDARPLAEIAADIDAELEFHVAESAHALEREGLEPELARAEALKRFGDYGRIRRECARTQMGERVMLQRIQLVLTGLLVAAVGMLAWSYQRAQVQARAAMDADRQATAALLARLEAQVAASAFPLRPRRPDASGAGGVTQMSFGSGGYLTSDGEEMDLASAARTWSDEFFAQNTAWRHGLKVAERLAALPGAQGAEILAQIWPQLSVEHKEQVMKPFVFDGGHPHALEVLELGFQDDATSVKERAVLYLTTYAWQNLWRGETTGSAWFAAWRDRPVEEVLRQNAERWAGQVGTLFVDFGSLYQNEILDLLPVVDDVRVETYAKAGVDLGSILRAHGLGGITAAHLAQIGDPAMRARAAKLASWCPAK